jgi:hypothetical protein
MLNLAYSNPKKQGDVGLGVAIGWFASHGYTVCVPLTDSQDYDLIVELEEQLFKVQVKTTRAKSKYGRYYATIKTSGGNRSGTGKVKRFDPSKVDLLFVVTAAEDKYLIPTLEFKAKVAISLGENYERYKVT